MYPERRPYATTMEHTGYRDKPLAPIPKPPAHALEILNAETGYDSIVPVRGSVKSRGRGMMLDRNGATSSLTRGSDNWGASAAPNGLFDGDDNDPLAEQKLQNPFKFATKMYHGSQQAVLNTELRFKLEKLVKDWEDRMDKLRTLMVQYPFDCATVNARMLEGIRSYLTGYRCAEDLTLPAAHLVQNLKLHTSLTEIEQAEAVPRLQIDGVQYTLNSLLTSGHLIAPLEEYLEALKVLDQVACFVIEGSDSCEGSGTALVKETAPSKGAILPSRAAISLHERNHFNPGEYTLGELQKSQDFLQNMEAQVLEAKSRKDAAVYRREPIEALRNLHAQIDLSNEMLLLNKTRMELVVLYCDDVRCMRTDVAEKMEGAEGAAARLRSRCSALLSKVAHDMEVLQEAIRTTHDELSELERQEQEAEAAAQEALKGFQTEEKGYWEQIRDLLEQLSGAASRKVEFMMSHMSQRERRARAYVETFSRLKAEEEHSERLSGVQMFAQRWEQGSGIYQKYVEAFIPKLLKRLSAIEESANDLNQNESQDYVRRYEMFAYAAEEARAKRSVQADRMRLTQRSMQMNQECAIETLDPTVEQHAQRYAEAGRELEEVLAYIAYLETIQQERKEEIDPVLQSVLSHNQLTTTDPLELEKQELQRLVAESVQAERQNGKGADVGNADRAASDPVECNEVLAAAIKAEDGVSSNAVTATQSMKDANGALSVLTKSVIHPFLSARQQGITHEEVYVEKHQQLNEAELCAVETKMDRIRKNKLEQAEMSMRYQNADYIRTLLAANDPTCQI
ncbi:unnamed protein product [Phytomonas sp. EM1]|nr:unnamed protein product [Phytomonas sp. EM1]|eukprot:CCW64538.1 unnamed protein product [Phytomonas sp. isolate EM1]